MNFTCDSFSHLPHATPPHLTLSFTDDVSASYLARLDPIASAGWMIDELLRGKDFEARGLTLIGITSWSRPGVTKEKHESLNEDSVPVHRTRFRPRISQIYACLGRYRYGSPLSFTSAYTWPSFLLGRYPFLMGGLLELSIDTSAVQVKYFLIFPNTT
jgi:hypothetical protein